MNYKIYAMKIVVYIEAENDVEALRQAQDQINDLQEVNKHHVLEIAEVLQDKGEVKQVRKIDLIELSNKVIYNEK